MCSSDLERRLCEEVHLNLAYRWFCRLGLDGKVPDHSTFSKNRHGRFRESDLPPLPQATADHAPRDVIGVVAASDAQDSDPLPGYIVAGHRLVIANISGLFAQTPPSISM